jgi:hypothetical protein
MTSLEDRPNYLIAKPTFYFVVQCQEFAHAAFSGIARLLNQELVSVHTRVRSQGFALLNPEGVLRAVFSFPSREVYAATANLESKCVSGEHQALVRGCGL